MRSMKPVEIGDVVELVHEWTTPTVSQTLLRTLFGMTTKPTWDTVLVTRKDVLDGHANAILNWPRLI